MKKLLLTMLAFVCTSIGALAQTPTVSQDGNTFIINSNGVADLTGIASLTINNSSIWADWNISGKTLKIVGNLSQTGIDEINTCLPNSAYQNVKLDLSGANMTTSLTGLPNKSYVDKCVLPAGTALPEPIGSNFSYVYSGAGTDTGVHLYTTRTFAGGISSLPDTNNLPELTQTVIDALKNGTTIYLSGTGASKMKTLLMSQNVPETKIDMTGAVNEAEASWVGSGEVWDVVITTNGAANLNGISSSTEASRNGENKNIWGWDFKENRTLSINGLLSQDGLDVVHGCLTNQNGGNHQLNLSGASLSGTITSLPNTGKVCNSNNNYYFNSAILPAGTEITFTPAEGYAYVYSPATATSNFNLYIADGSKSLADIGITASDINSTNKIKLTGPKDDVTAFKNKLIAAGVAPANIIDNLAPYDDQINCAGNALTLNMHETPGNLAAAIEMAKGLFSETTTLRHLKVVGTINATDLEALKNFNVTNGESIDLSKVTLSPATLAQTGDFSFNDTENSNPNLKYVILPRNVDEINQTWFTTLTNLNAAITYSYDATDNSKLQAYVKTPNTLAETIVRLAADKCNQYKAEYDDDLNVSFATGASGVNKIDLKQGGNEGDANRPGKNVTAVKISGHISARDISNDNGHVQGQVFDENGHFVFSEPSTETTKQTTRVLRGTAQLCALAGANNVISIDLGGAIVDEEHNDDLTLSFGGVLNTNTKEVIIPTSPAVKTIPADFMNMSHSVFQICIPGNIENIKTRAFATTQIDHIWTTDDDPTIKTDNGIVTAVDANGDATETKTGQLPLTATRSDYLWGTYTFPAGLKLIESYAFGTNEQSGARVKDVYVLAINAPECHVNAFQPVMYHGNNGFKSGLISKEGIITRDAYRQDNDTYNWITMLHFPRECVTPAVQRYTDPTREYSVATGDVDGNGSPIYYPNQCEMDRAFQQGTTGYLWNAWDPTRNPDGSNSFLKTSIDRYNLTVYYYTSAGQQIANGVYNDNSTIPAETKQWTSFYDVTDGGTFQQPDGLIPYDQVYRNNSQFNNNAQGTQLYPTGQDYRGWHQFVLTGYAHNSNLVFEPLKSYISDNDWWTICAPYNLRYSDIILLFGDKNNPQNLPYLSKLLYVVRNVKNQKITLMFSKNLMEYMEYEIVKVNDEDVKRSINNPTDLTKPGDHVHGIVDDTPWSETDLQNDPVILHAGVPYLIKPYMSADNNGRFNRQFDIYSSNQPEGLSKPEGAIVNDWLYNSFLTSRKLTGDQQKNLIYKGVYKVPAYVINNTGDYPETTRGAGVTMEVELKDGSKFKYSPTGFNFNGVTQAEISGDFTYSFVGSFYKSLMPKFCYFLGWDNENNHAAFWYNRFNDPANYTWNNETGIICPNWNLDHTITPASTGKGGVLPARWEAVSSEDLTETADIYNDDFKGSNQEAKGYMDMTFGNDMWLDDNLGGATGVKEIVTVVNDDIVYDVHGVKVGTALQGLAKGVYILNGKKFVVK